MRDGHDEACASLILKDIIDKFWDSKDIFELEEDFDLLFQFYENMKYYQDRWYGLGLNIEKPKHLQSNERK